MDALTTASENALMGALLGTSYAATPPLMCALVTEMGTDAMPGTEVTGGGYARMALDPTAVSDGYVFNSSAVTFSAMPTCTVVGMEIWDSASHRLWHGRIPTTPLSDQEALTFPTGSIMVHLGGLPDPRTVTVSTHTLDDLQTWGGTVALGRTFKIIRVECSHPCRVRVYSTLAQQSADYNRPIGTLPAGDHGLIFEYVADATHLSADLSPQAEGSNLEQSSVPDIATYIQNRSGGNVDVSVTFTYLKLEV